MDKKILFNIRKDYIFEELNEDGILSDPFRQFEKWFNEAIDAEITEVNAMFIATCGKNGMPAVRTVLLKEFDPRGFSFYTNYSSRKGNDLSYNPKASALFFWKELERQIRIEGTTEKVTRSESEEYFHSRPAGSQIAAMTSEQSKVISGRNILDNKFRELTKQYEGKIIPLPDNWGGYRIIPERIEFWQGRKNRLHDRILYTKENEEWKTERLSP